MLAIYADIYGTAFLSREVVEMIPELPYLEPAHISQ